MITGSLDEVSTSPKVLDWTLSDYFRQSQAINFTMYSPEFEFEGVKCRLAVQPNGTDRVSNVFILALYGVEKKGIRRWELELWRANGTLLRKSIGFREDGDEVLVRMYIPTEEVVRGCQVDDSLTMRCTIYWTDFKCMEEARHRQVDYTMTQTEDIRRLDQLACDCEELMLREDYTDVLFKVEEKEYKAHRSILSIRNPVFDSMFKHEMSESVNGVVNIEDCDPPVFRELIRFLYSGRLQKFSTNNLANVYQLADKYQATELKAYCTQHIMDFLEPETFADALVIPANYDEKELMDKLTKFFEENMTEIKNSEKWQNFAAEHPEAADKFLLAALKLREIRKAKENVFQKFVGRLRGRKC